MFEDKPVGCLIPSASSGSRGATVTYPELVHSVPERTGVYPKQLGRAAGAVDLALGHVQDARNVLPDDRVEVRRWFIRIDRRRGGCFRQGIAEVVEPKRVALMKTHGALHNVFEFAYVAGPMVVHQGIDGAGAQRRRVADFQALLRVHGLCQQAELSADRVRVPRLATAQGDIRLASGQIDEVEVG